MTFLLDENISPGLCPLLEKMGYGCNHIQNLQLSGKSDLAIVEIAEANNWIIITHDLDFSRIISISGRKKPSVITFRLDKISLSILHGLLKANITSLEEKLKHGSLITISMDKIRFQYLPLTRD